MTTATSNYYDVASQMQAGRVHVFHNATWEEYEELLEQVGETRPGLRISFNDGTLKIMSLSLEHETYAEFIKRMVAQLSFRLRIKIRSSGSTTMRKQDKSKGNEPDAAYYVKTAAIVGKRLDLDFAVDPPPDFVVEVDIHHASTENDSIYAALGVPEIWRYDGWEMTILHLQGNQYVTAKASLALPMLTSAILTEYLERLREDGEDEAIRRVVARAAAITQVLKHSARNLRGTTTPMRATIHKAVRKKFFLLEADVDIP